ncbi:hypothetical protein BU23DRAFT_169742 [Bimuria novae-zelandiae CBS 107.79]|uniref:Uncharacterized protein n=1 Tax=Bimuria novae-zelandiae CBS 107.79 TaxID=1447943 RepID=A0A6A5V576_9PLEO|nr:hypothetical protein BU23DRAFT_169742 [Bimuria novae-zelandiae CBS 107.79]
MRLLTSRGNFGFWSGELERSEDTSEACLVRLVNVSKLSELTLAWTWSSRCHMPVFYLSIAQLESILVRCDKIIQVPGIRIEIRWRILWVSFLAYVGWQNPHLPWLFGGGDKRIPSTVLSNIPLIPRRT